jgi:hypothetical protein
LIGGTWESKQGYFTPDEAEAAIGRQAKVWYLCEPPDGCGMYHHASKRKDVENAN